MEPPLSEKMHMIDLVHELREYVRDLPGLIRLPKEQRIIIAERMMDIKKRTSGIQKEVSRSVEKCYILLECMVVIMVTKEVKDYGR
jgi:hypothetical protein